MNRLGLMVGVGGWLFALTAAPVMAQTPGQQQAQTLDTSVSTKTRYLLYLPKEYGKEAGKKWPLLIFLHGSGERGEDLERVKLHGPPKLIAQGKEFPFVVVSPQAHADPVSNAWKPDVLNRMLDDLLTRYAIDADRVYLTGLSMGGFGTWAWAASYPERFAAIAPICGGGQTLFVSRSLKEMPVWAFHGVKDPVVPVSESEVLIEALRKAGAKEAKLTLYPDLDHDSWTVTYDNPELYTWLLSHTRKKPETK